MLNISRDFLAGLFSFLLTLMILSYAIKDNPLFRVAVYIFVGVSAGYAGAVAIRQVIIPQLLVPLITIDRSNIFRNLLYLIPLVLGALLLMKISPRWAHLGNVSMAFMVGVGVAVAISGAVMGTIFPQIQSTINLPKLSSALGDVRAALSSSGQQSSNLENFFSGCVILLGTAATLVYFHFGAKATPTGPKRNKLVNILGAVGQGFIAITFGVLFAGVFTAAITALIERLSFMVNFIR